MIKSDILAILTLTTLYTIQGILLTIFGSTFPLILSEMGYSISQLSYLNFSNYPFALKIFFAPFLDTYYSKSFGERKSYIVPMNYIAGALLVISSFYVTDWIEQGFIKILSLLGFSLIFTIALQDIATDAWGVKIMSREKISYVPLSQAFGMQIGFVLANTAFIQFKLNEATFFYYFGLFTLFFTMIIHFFIDEYGFDKTKKLIYMKEEEDENQLIDNNKEGDSPKKNTRDINTLINTMRGFYHNSNLRLLILLIFFQNLGIGPILSTFTLKIQKAGISKKRISISQFYQFPIKSLVTFIVAKYLKNTLKLGHTLLIIQLFLQILQFIFYHAQLANLFEGDLMYLQISLLVLIQLVESLILTSLIQTRITFFSTIATASLEGIYITALSSVQNIGRKWVISSFQYFDDYLNFNFVTILLWIFYVFYIFKSEKIFKRMDQLDRKEWCLIETMENKNLNKGKKDGKLAENIDTKNQKNDQNKEKIN